MAQSCSSGVLCDENGHVQGLWLSFLGDRNSDGRDNEYNLGVPIGMVECVLKKLRKGEMVGLKGFCCEFIP